MDTDPNCGANTADDPTMRNRRYSICCLATTLDRSLLQCRGVVLDGDDFSGAAVTGSSVTCIPRKPANNGWQTVVVSVWHTPLLALISHNLGYCGIVHKRYSGEQVMLNL